MKSLIYLFGQDEPKKSFKQFAQLGTNDMMLVKGGEGDPDDEDLWPPVPPLPPTTK